MDQSSSHQSEMVGAIIIHFSWEIEEKQSNQFSFQIRIFYILFIKLSCSHRRTFVTTDFTRKQLPVVSKTISAAKYCLSGKTMRLWAFSTGSDRSPRGLVRALRPTPPHRDARPVFQYKHYSHKQVLLFLFLFKK